jgi:hypothetical protein
MSDTTAVSIAQDAIASKRSNKDLTVEEKQAKRDLKKELKQKRKRARLETRLLHAVSRKDPQMEQQTREDLAAMGIIVSVKVDEQEDAAREFVLDLYRRLKQNQGKGSASIKQQQIDQAIHLLRHMTKGTQEKDMFEEQGALWGYARQKFQERAMLVYKSFARLQPDKQPTEIGEEEGTRRRKTWEALMNVKVISSIGCGPGCDAVGVLSFLDQHSPGSKLESMVLLDWAMDKWRAVLDLLNPLMKPSLVENIHCDVCDISKLIGDDMNSSLRWEGKDVDLYLFSYILTETRGKWEAFLKELVDGAKSNCLFYLAEPTPWQLHRLRNLLPNLDYVWVDSSMNQSPAMQALDGRMSPGVLMARKP